MKKLAFLFHNSVYTLVSTIIIISLFFISVVPAFAENADWVITGSMTATRIYHTATLLPDGKVLVAGGQSGSSPLSTAELYDPASGTWSTTGSMTTARSYHTATVLPDGNVLVAGGQSGSSSLSSAEIYNPSNGTWEDTGSMSIFRTYATATLLTNGKVLVTGGCSGVDCRYSFLASAELYDPVAHTWSTTGPMIVERAGHTATLLPNGKVLIAGGEKSFGTYYKTLNAQNCMTQILGHGQELDR